MNEELRVQYRQWLLRGDLDETVADAILEAMPPYDWHNIARKEDIERLDSRMDGFDGRMDGLDSRMDGLDGRMEGLEQQMVELKTDFGALAADQKATMTAIGSLTTEVRELATNVEVDRGLIKFIAQGNDRSVDQHLAVMSAVNGIHKQLTAAAIAVILAIAGMVSAGVIAAIQIATPS